MQLGKNRKVNISVIMTALNEEGNILAAIANTLGAFKDFNIGGEIIVVDDGSTDKTGDLVNDIISKDDHVRMIKHDSPEGVGASFWDGVDVAKGEIITWFPGDDENDPREIFRYYRLLEHVDIVIPFVFNKEVRSAFRNTISSIYRLMVNTIFSINFNYTNGTILYRSSILRELEHRSEGFFFQTDILVTTTKKGYLFAEVPYRLGLRKDGESNAISFVSVVQVLKECLQLLKHHYFKKGSTTGIHFSEGTMTAKRRRRNQRSSGG